MRIAPDSIALAALTSAALAILSATAGAAIERDTVQHTQPQAPLIGTQCNGVRSAVIVGTSESAMPQCAAIERANGAALAMARIDWQAVLEYRNGESDVIERGTLADCIAAITPYDATATVAASWCERVDTRRDSQ